MTQIRCELITLASIYELSYQLAMKIIRSGYKPDLIIAIARGGFAPARFLCDFLYISDMTSIKIQHYAPGALKETKAWVKYPLSADIKNKRVLLVDDVNDTGDSLAVAQEHLKTFEPQDLKVAVLHQKRTTTFQADYVARNIKKWRWIIYPWAVVEDVGAFLERMQPPFKTRIEARDRLFTEYGIRISLRVLDKILNLQTSRPIRKER